MKILQILPVFTLGGVETMCENLSTELARMGQDVVIGSLFTQKTAITDRLEARGIRIEYLDKKMGFDRALFARLRALLREERPDVVHTHLYTAKYVQNAARKLGVPVRVHTVHNMAPFEFGKPDQFVNRRLYRRGLTPISLSREIQKTVTDLYGLTEEQTPVILNGVPLENCIPKETYAPKAVRFLHVGRFTPQKNHAVLIRAFAQAHSLRPEIRLELYGEGPLLAESRDLVHELVAESFIRFCGLSDSMYGPMHDADVFLLPSTYEGVPMTLIEAMGTGLPILTSPVGGIPDMLENEVSALIVPPEEEPLVRAIVRIADDAALRERLGRAALSRAPLFSSKKMAENYLALYEEKYRAVSRR